MNPDANWFATVALLSWPVVALWLFHVRSVSQAIVWTILGAYLLLPVDTGFKFEGVPLFDKTSIPNIAALVGCVLAMRRFPRILHGVGIPDILILMLLIGPFITSQFNGDTITIGVRVLPGVGHYDALSAVATQFIVFLPFFLGRQFFRTPEDTAYILRMLVIVGLAYSVPMLFEVRMSPQLHAWIYGSGVRSFVQQVRFDGYRPVVFLGHGLSAAFFTMTTVVAAAALWRTQIHLVRLPPGGVAAYLSVVLVFCKTLGAVIYGAVLFPLVRWATPRLQLRVAMVLVSIALTYPILRTADVIPTTVLLETAAAVSADRADSLKMRLDNEKWLLEHASQRPLFGWGRFGRSRIYDPASGDDITTSDGYWIIVMGTFGLFGFLAEFGLLALSVFRAASALKFAESTHDKIFLAALALIVAVNMIDLLPNSTITSWTWLFAGALLGRAEALRAHARQGPLPWGSKPAV